MHLLSSMPHNSINVDIPRDKMLMFWSIPHVAAGLEALSSTGSLGMALLFASSGITRLRSFEFKFHGRSFLQSLGLSECVFLDCSFHQESTFAQSPQGLCAPLSCGLRRTLKF